MNVSSMTYNTEAQFMEAVAQAKAARETREIRQASVAQQENFRTLFNQSLSKIDDGSKVYAGAVPTESNIQSVLPTEDLDSIFNRASETYGVSVDLLKAVAWQESNYHTDVVSSSGAVGVMQLMPQTASYLGVTNPYDPEQNIMGGAKLLAELQTRYNGNLDLTLAAYNAGTGTVEKYGGVPPYDSVQKYIAKIKGMLGM